MREIVLQPGTSIEIDGVRVRAVEPVVSGGSANEDGPNQLLLSDDDLELLRAATAGWIISGDLSQVHLLKDSVGAVARLISILREAEQKQSGAESNPSSHPEAAGTPV